MPSDNVNYLVSFSPYDFNYKFDLFTCNSIAYNLKVLNIRSDYFEHRFFKQMKNLDLNKVNEFISIKTFLQKSFFMFFLFSFTF